MLDWVRKKTEAMVGLGFTVAGKAVAQVLDLVFDAARLIQKTTGVGVPLEQAAPEPWEPERPTDPAPGPAEPVGPAEPSGPTLSEKVPPRKEEAAEPAPARPKPAPAPAKTAGKAKKSAAQKASGKKRTSRKAAKAKPPRRRSQILRILSILAEDPNRWMTAVELSKATAAQGTKILPGNIRKAVRLRAEGLIESRIRPNSARGATEYRITEAGLEYLEEHGGRS